MNLEPFDLEKQYKTYLRTVGLDEAKMPLIQRTETKRAFMGACGQMLLIVFNDFENITEDEGIEALEHMKKQVETFFLNEMSRKN